MKTWVEFWSVIKDRRADWKLQPRWDCRTRQFKTPGGRRVSQEAGCSRGDRWAQTCREVERWAGSVSFPGQAALRAVTPGVSHLGKENKDLDCEAPKSSFQIKASFEFHFGNPAPGGQRRGVRREKGGAGEQGRRIQAAWSPAWRFGSHGGRGRLPVSLIKHTVSAAIHRGARGTSCFYLPTCLMEMVNYLYSRTFSSCSQSQID